MPPPKRPKSGSAWVSRYCHHSSTAIGGQELAPEEETKRHLDSEPRTETEKCVIKSEHCVTSNVPTESDIVQNAKQKLVEHSEDPIDQNSSNKNSEKQDIDFTEKQIIILKDENRSEANPRNLVDVSEISKSENNDIVCICIPNSQDGVKNEVTTPEDNADGSVGKPEDADLGCVFKDTAESSVTFDQDKSSKGALQNITNSHSTQDDVPGDLSPVTDPPTDHIKMETSEHENMSSSLDQHKAKANVQPQVIIITSPYLHPVGDTNQPIAKETVLIPTNASDIQTNNIQRKDSAVVAKDTDSPGKLIPMVKPVSDVLLCQEMSCDKPTSNTSKNISKTLGQHQEIIAQLNNRTNNYSRIVPLSHCIQVPVSHKGNPDKACESSSIQPGPVTRYITGKVAPAASAKQQQGMEHLLSTSSTGYTDSGEPRTSDQGTSKQTNATHMPQKYVVPRSVPQVPETIWGTLEQPRQPTAENRLVQGDHVPSGASRQASNELVKVPLPTQNQHKVCVVHGPLQGNAPESPCERKQTFQLERLLRNNNVNNPSQNADVTSNHNVHSTHISGHDMVSNHEVAPKWIYGHDLTSNHGVHPRQICRDDVISNLSVESKQPPRHVISNLGVKPTQMSGHDVITNHGVDHRQASRHDITNHGVDHRQASRHDITNHGVDHRQASRHDITNHGVDHRQASRHDETSCHVDPRQMPRNDARLISINALGQKFEDSSKPPKLIAILDQNIRNVTDNTKHSPILQVIMQSSETTYPHQFHNDQRHIQPCTEMIEHTSNYDTQHFRQVTLNEQNIHSSVARRLSQETVGSQLDKMIMGCIKSENPSPVHQRFGEQTHSDAELQKIGPRLRSERLSSGGPTQESQNDRRYECLGQRERCRILACRGQCGGATPGQYQDPDTPEDLSLTPLALVKPRPGRAEPNPSHVNDSQHGVNNSQHGVSESQHGVNNSQHGVNNSQHGVNNSQHGVSESQHGINNSQHGVNNSQHGVNNSQHGVNTQHGVNNSQHGVNNSQHGVSESQHGVLHEDSGSRNASTATTPEGCKISSLDCGRVIDLSLTKVQIKDTPEKKIMVTGCMNTILSSHHMSEEQVDIFNNNIQSRNMGNPRVLPSVGQGGNLHSQALSHSDSNHAVLTPGEHKHKQLAKSAHTVVPSTDYKYKAENYPVKLMSPSDGIPNDLPSLKTSDEDSHFRENYVPNRLPQDVLAHVPHQVSPQMPHQVSPQMSHQVSPPKSQQMSHQVSPPMTQNLLPQMSHQMSSPMSQQMSPQMSHQVSPQMPQQMSPQIPNLDNASCGSGSVHSPCSSLGSLSPSREWTGPLERAVPGCGSGAGDQLLVSGDTDIPTETIAQPKNFSPHQCQICNDSASGFHYGVWSCEGCKAFFKRSLQGPVDYICPATNNCTIDKHRRKSCQACRLRKCIERGMSRGSCREKKMHRKCNRQLKRKAPDSLLECEVPLNKTPKDSVTMEIKEAEQQQSVLKREPLVCPVHPQVKKVQDLANQLPRLYASPPDTPQVHPFVEHLMKIDPPVRFANNNSNNDNGQRNNVLEMILKIMNLELLDIVSWAKGIPGYMDLDLPDRMRLMEMSWMEILILGFVWRSVPHENLLAIAPDLNISQHSLAREDFWPVCQRVLILVNSVRQVKLTREELLLLRTSILLNAGVHDLGSQVKFQDLQDRVTEALHYTVGGRHQQPFGRISRLLLLLPQLRQISLEFVGYLSVLKDRDQLPETCHLIGEILSNQNSPQNNL